MTMGSISFQSNISMILITLIIILATIYFYLDTRKMKLQIENLENNNKMFIKEVEKLNKGLHSIISYTNLEGCPANNSEKDSNTKNNDKDIKVIEKKNEEEVINVDNKEGNENSIDITDNFEAINNTDIVENNTDILKNNTDIVENNTDILKNNTDILKNNIIDDNNNILDDVLNDVLNDELNDEIELDDEIDDCIVDGDGDEDGDGDGNEDEEDKDILDLDLDINSEESIDILGNNSYSDMSVKELKNKCIELGLKHSGNKHTLAQRIIDKLGN
jgi:hypothetical protein